jgi:hypothetical protein
MSISKKIWSYLTFQKQPEFESQTDKIADNHADKSVDSNSIKNMSYLKMMHGINRISIIMFLIGMIIVVIKITK